MPSDSDTDVPQTTHSDAPDSVAPEAAGAVRRASNAASRALTGTMRSRAASQRDAAARRRDMAAAARDRTSAAQDRARARSDAARLAGAQPQKPASLIVASAARSRQRAASDRAHAAGDRAGAAKDRAFAADDRRYARVALRDAHLDELTGAYSRGLGLLTLGNEIQRAQRSGESFVVALVDVDGLKAINDCHGREAGDAMLRAVAAALRAHLRSYDPIVRVGGDEFLCAFANTPLAVAAQRLETVRQALSTDGSISGALAELHPRETLEALVARARDELDGVKRGA